MKILQGDCLEVLKTLPKKSVQMCVTSPPYYGLRDYGVSGQIGLEETPQAYVDKLVAVFQEVKRVLKDDGVLWLNLGDSYASVGVVGQTDELTGWQHGPLENEKRSRARGAGNGVKPKDLIGIPWMVAFALRNDGWYLRQDIIWAKPNPMPESVKDRCTKSHEYIFLLSKNQKYYYDYEAVLEPAAYDGRKDTQYKGGEKDVSCFEHERWPAKIRGFKTKDQLPDNQHHGKDIQSYGLNGAGFQGHSGNYDADGNSLLYEQDGLPARNKRSVWTITTKPYREAHFATFPEDIPEICIKAGSKPGDIVLDPFNGSGTTGAVATRLRRDYIGIELNPAYIELTHKRLSGVQVEMI